MNADKIIELLGLEPHPSEGGYYIETYRSAETITASALPDRYPTERSVSTAIHYMLTAGMFSAMHRLKSDEVYHFYLGQPVEMLLLYPDGSHEVIILGSDILSGQKNQIVVPYGVWQGSRLMSGGEFALMGTTVAPGFEFADYEHGERDALIRAYPDCERLILELTRA